MPRQLLSSIAFAAATLTSCAVPEPARSQADGAEARYVEASSLLTSDEHRRTEVLTSVELHEISAEDVETLIQGELPANVRVARTGQSDALLLQGPGEQVVAAIEVVRRLDAR
ncbi:MAG: hypothetical protein AAF196_05730 [Planctomycetota bacterium]